MPYISGQYGMAGRIRLKPKLGTWGAVAASGVIGVVVAIGLMAVIRS